MGLASLDSQSTFCISENKAILLIDDTTEETHQLQDFCNIFTDPLDTYYITLSSSIFLFHLLSCKAATISLLDPQLQDSNWYNVEEHQRGFGIFMA